MAKVQVITQHALLALVQAKQFACSLIVHHAAFASPMSLPPGKRIVHEVLCGRTGMRTRQQPTLPWSSMTLLCTRLERRLGRLCPALQVSGSFRTVCPSPALCSSILMHVA